MTLTSSESLFATYSASRAGLCASALGGVPTTSSLSAWRSRASTTVSVFEPQFGQKRVTDVHRPVALQSTALAETQRAWSNPWQ